MGIFLLIALENILPPIPSEVILTFGGFMTTTCRKSSTVKKKRRCLRFFETSPLNYISALPE
jgi:hypothetical protein